MKTNCTRNGKNCKWLKTVGHPKYAVQVCIFQDRPTALTSLPLYIRNKECVEYEPEKEKHESPFE